MLWKNETQKLYVYQGGGVEFTEFLEYNSNSIKVTHGKATEYNISLEICVNTLILFLKRRRKDFQRK